MYASLDVEECIGKVISAAKSLSEQCQLGYSVASAELRQPRHHLLSLMSELQVLLFQPADFLRHLAIQAR